MKKINNKPFLSGIIAVFAAGLIFSVAGLLLPSCEKAFVLNYKPTAADVQIVSDPGLKDSIKKEYPFKIKIILNNFAEGNNFGYKLAFEKVQGEGEFFIGNNQYFEPVPLAAKETNCSFLTITEGGKVSFVVTVIDAQNGEVVNKKQFTLNAFVNKAPLPAAQIHVTYSNKGACFVCPNNSCYNGIKISVSDLSKDEDQIWGGNVVAVYVRYSMLIKNNPEFWSGWEQVILNGKKDIFPNAFPCPINQIQIRAVDNQNTDNVVWANFTTSGL